MKFTTSTKPRAARRESKLLTPTCCGSLYFQCTILSQSLSYRSTNHDVVLQEAQNCMKRADVNGDGEVDFEEFKKAVQSNSVEILFELEI